MLAGVVLQIEPSPDWKGGGAVPEEWSVSGTLESGVKNDLLVIFYPQVFWRKLDRPFC